jgi:hypothetical protein
MLAFEQSARTVPPVWPRVNSPPGWCRRCADRAPPASPSADGLNDPVAFVAPDAHHLHRDDPVTELGLIVEASSARGAAMVRVLAPGLKRSGR